MYIFKLSILLLFSSCGSLQNSELIKGAQGEHVGFCHFNLGENGIYEMRFIPSPQNIVLFKSPKLKGRMVRIDQSDKISPVEVLQFYHDPGLYRDLSGDKYSHQFYVGEGIYKYKNTEGKLVEVEEIQEITPSVSTEVLKLRAIVKGKEYTGYTLNNLFKDRIEGCD